MSLVPLAELVTSPLQRASKPCELAGFPLTLPSPPAPGGEGRVRGAGAEVDRDLIEWDYGRFEGKLTGASLKERPGWELYRGDCDPASVGVLGFEHNSRDQPIIR